MVKKNKIELPDNVKKWLDEENQKHVKYNHFLKSIKNLDPKIRVLKWLEYIADELDNYGDEEALIYLVSRGYDCSERIEKLRQYWKNSAYESMKQCASGASYHNLTTGESKMIGSMSIAEAFNIKKLPTSQLRNFWGYSDSQELTIDATMLRAVEWCEIGGFQDWWERLAREVNEDILYGGLQPVPASFWLFNMCRSDLAIRLMRRALERCLETIGIPYYKQEFPWTILMDQLINKERKLLPIDHIPYICSIIFSNYKLHGFKKSQDLIDNALEALLKHQKEDGSWNCWAGDKKSDVESTAMAIHAIILGKPTGWKRSIKKTKDWLLSQQSEYGYWSSPGAPDLVHLTVLALDAIDLIDGNKNLTFTMSSGIIEESNEKPIIRRFKVALSFPGEHRDYVESIANGLAREIGKEKIFYDKFYEAELARPNLDTYLQKIYHDESDLIVVFLCSEYNKKEWCGLEWRAIRDLIKMRKDEDIMPLRFDNTKVPGLFSIDGYIDINNRDSTEIIKLIIERIK